MELRPCLPPEDNELKERINAIIESVKDSWPAKEERIKENYLEDPNFSFLFNGNGCDYYKWHLYCVLNQIPLEEEIRMAKLELDNQRIEPIPVGFAQLLEQDFYYLRDNLIEISGSMRNIQNLREWIISRPNNSMHISIILRTYVSNPTTIYNKKLYTLFVINDTLNILKKQFDIKFTEFGKSILPQIPHMLAITYISGSNESEKIRIIKLLNIWTKNEFLSQRESNDFMNLIRSNIIPPYPPDPQLFSTIRRPTIRVSVPTQDTPIPTIGEMANYVIYNMQHGGKPYIPVNHSLPVPDIGLDDILLDQKFREFEDRLEKIEQEKTYN